MVSSTEYTEDTEEDVPDDHCDHASPCVETERNKRRAGCPAAYVEAASDDPERYKLTGTKAAAVWWERESVFNSSDSIGLTI